MSCQQDKEFHVSPFMGMEQGYQFRLTAPGERLSVGIVNLQNGAGIFDAALVLQRLELVSLDDSADCAGNLLAGTAIVVEGGPLCSSSGE